MKCEKLKFKALRKVKLNALHSEWAQNLYWSHFLSSLTGSSTTKYLNKIQVKLTALHSEQAQNLFWGYSRFITHCAGCYLPVICQWLCPEWSFLFLISFSWTQYPTLNTIIYLVHFIDVLLYIPHFSSILNDLWRGGEAKLLTAMAKWQITGARQCHF